MTARLRTNPDVAEAFEAFPDGGFTFVDVTDRAGARSRAEEHHLWTKPICDEELADELLVVLDRSQAISSLRTRLVLAALVTLMDRDTRLVQVGTTMLANCIGIDYISPRTVQRCIAWLIETGRVECLDNQSFGSDQSHANTYRVLSLNRVLS